jgi:hypothetical protein
MPSYNKLKDITLKRTYGFVIKKLIQHMNFTFQHALPGSSVLNKIINDNQSHPGE